jgi:hypothetical protein
VASSFAFSSLVGFLVYGNPAALRFTTTRAYRDHHTNISVPDSSSRQIPASRTDYYRIHAVGLTTTEFIFIVVATMTTSHGYQYNLGSFHRKVSTGNAEAQLWFDRGLIWCYAFHHEESARCFARAINSDPTCAMAYWGVSTTAYRRHKS